MFNLKAKFLRVILQNIRMVKPIPTTIPPLTTPPQFPIPSIKESHFWLFACKQNVRWTNKVGNQHLLSMLHSKYYLDKKKFLWSPVTAFDINGRERTAIYEFVRVIPCLETYYPNSKDTIHSVVGARLYYHCKLHRPYVRQLVYLHHFARFTAFIGVNVAVGFLLESAILLATRWYNG